MQLHTLITITEKTKRRLGQGHGSGRVKTGGRGTKGQKARGHIPLRFEGGALPLIKRLPFLRGKQKNKAFKLKFAVINLSDLAQLPADTIIDIPTLVKHNLVMEKQTRRGVKILGDGEVSKKFTVKVAISKAAQEKIEKAGGRIEADTIQK